jgi:hypothetical protein
MVVKGLPSNDASMTVVVQCLPDRIIDLGQRAADTPALRCGSPSYLELEGAARRRDTQAQIGGGALFALHPLASNLLPRRSLESADYDARELGTKLGTHGFRQSECQSEQGAGND